MRNFLTERGDEADYDDGAVVVAPDIAIDDRFRRSAHHLRYERLLLWAEPNGVLVCDGELRLRVARNWQEFVCSVLPDFEPNVRLSNVRLFLEPTTMPPTPAKLPALYDVQLQCLTNTASRLTVQRRIDCGAIPLPAQRRRDSQHARCRLHARRWRRRTHLVPMVSAFRCASQRKPTCTPHESCTCVSQLGLHWARGSARWVTWLGLLAHVAARCRNRP